MSVSWTFNAAPDDFGRIGAARNALLDVLQAKLREHGLNHTVQERLVTGDGAGGGQAAKGKLKSE